jgi:hypothetical protein
LPAANLSYRWLQTDDITERSQFIRQAGRWWFMDSTFVEEGEAGTAAGAAAAPAAAPAAADVPAAAAPKKKGFLGLF